MAEQKTGNSILPKSLGCLAALMLSCGLIFGGAFIAGPAIMAVPGLGDRITTMIFCPGATSSSLDEGASTQTTTDPTSTYGHTVNITCNMPDGTQQEVPNELVALGNIGGSFGVGALVGICLSIPVLLVAAIFMFRSSKPKQGS